jgi:pantoate--beta-alanine ligase
MKVLKTISELRAYRGRFTGSVGFVPTMGFLHEGHLSLIRQSRAECDHTVVSIFVNPTQFGPSEDFKNYPRDIERDLALLEKTEADAVFLPEAGEMYSPSTDTFVMPGKIAERLEGAARPGHFKGVATVVLKLFNLVQPHRAYFGQKDAQQVTVIRKMISDLDVPVSMVVIPTVRESDGLAMSSRNNCLTPAERQAATVLYRSLRLADDLIARGERDAEIIRHQMIEMIESEPLASLDYISVANAGSLEELNFVVKPALVSLAVRIGRTRLIDNTLI